MLVTFSMQASENPLLPSLGHYEVPASFKNDLEVLDRYQAFSAEILRIALLGLSALGVAASSVILIPKRSPGDLALAVPLTAKLCIVIAALGFCLSAAAAALHRYFSANSMACQIRILRLELKGSAEATTRLDRERGQRQTMFTLSSICIAIAPGALAAGGIAFAIALAFALFQSRYQ